MAKAATAELQEQIDKIRHEAFAAGYAAAMKAVQELASRPAQTSVSATVTLNGGGRRRRARSASANKANGARRIQVKNAPKASRGSAPKSQRGTNALRVEEILKAVSPRAVRPATIRKTLQEKGMTISFPSLRHALQQLAARKAAQQVGNSRTWRYRPSTWHRTAARFVRRSVSPRTSLEKGSGHPVEVHDSKGAGHSINWPARAREGWQHGGHSARLSSALATDDPGVSWALFRLVSERSSHWTGRSTPAQAAAVPDQHLITSKLVLAGSRCAVSDNQRY